MQIETLFNIKDVVKFISDLWDMNEASNPRGIICHIKIHDKGLITYGVVWSNSASKEPTEHYDYELEKV